MPEGALQQKSSEFAYLGQSDQIYVTWQVSRNARTLIEQPSQLFDSVMCFPSPNMLALGEPMIAMGMLGTPGHLLTGDPIATYNFSLVALTLLSALGMYWLVREWSGSPAAGIAAGLLYAFHPGKLREIMHPYADDTVWAVLALLFARRLLARGRWRDGIATGALAAMQAASSFYPFAAATFAALPLLVWMLVHHGFRQGFREGIGKLPAGPLVAAVAIFSGGLYVVYGPYLEQHASAQLADATVHVYAAWSMFAPGGPGFPGVLTLALVLAALVLRGRRAPLPIGGDPSFALLASIALVGIVCIGGRSGLDAPPVYSWLAEHVPGFDSVRRPYKMISGIHLAVCILAGLGAGAFLQRVPERSRRYATGALLALALLCAVRADFAGHRHRVLFEPFSIAPPAEEIAFYATLAEAGNAGPILEVPPGSLQHNARRVLLNGYHDRPTSACINAHSPDTPEVLELMLALPSAGAIEQARRLGFTTLVLSHPTGLAPSHRWLTRLAKATGPAGPLQPLHASGNLSAYTLVSPAAQHEPD